MKCQEVKIILSSRIRALMAQGAGEKGRDLLGWSVSKEAMWNGQTRLEWIHWSFAGP